MPFDLQPTLTGRLLHLRPLTLADFDALFSVASDPLIWEQHPNSDRYKKEVFEIFFRDALASRGALLAIDNKTSRVIGFVRGLRTTIEELLHSRHQPMEGRG